MPPVTSLHLRCVLGRHGSPSAAAQLLHRHSKAGQCFYHRRHLHSQQQQSDLLSDTRVTVLPSGMRVATYYTPSHFTAVGVCVDAGSRYETPINRGVSHFVDRLAFKSIDSASELDQATLIASLGGNVFCSSTRESILYQAAVLHDNLPVTLSMLCSSVLHPYFTNEEVDSVRRNIAYELEDLQSRPETLATELLHATAFGKEDLGSSLMCDASRLELIQRDVILDYHRQFFTLDRMVVAGSGIEHEQLVQLVKTTFGNEVSKQPASARSIERPLKAIRPTHYQGGSLLQAIPPPPPTHPNPTRLLTYVQLAFPVESFMHPDIYVVATLQLLMGGGGSFSAGGPGKGMYSRLYTNVLNRYQWMESCQSFHHSYNDAGLFGISAACDPQYNSHVLNVIIGELLHMSEMLSDSEIIRAKNMLKSSLLMNLESQMVQLEDIGRQVQVMGRRVEASEMIDNIDKVTRSDLERVAQKLLTHRPSFVAVGEQLQGLPDVEHTLSLFLAGKTKPRWSYKL